MSRRPFLIGLTGSIGMGKTTTAQMFADEGIPVWDADAAVHRMYRAGGAAVGPMRRLRSDAIIDGSVSRTALKGWISEDPAALERIEGIVHPLVAADRKEFIKAAVTEMLVLDMPLLFETGGEGDMDAVAVVSVPHSIQRRRVLERGNVSESQFDALLARQMPYREKRSRAAYVIEMGFFDRARAAVRYCLRDIAGRLADA